MIGGAIQVLGGLLKLAGLLTEYLRNKRLIEAGKAEAIADALTVANKEMDKVLANRARFKRDPDYAQRVRDSFKLNREP